MAVPLGVGDWKLPIWSCIYPAGCRNYPITQEEVGCRAIEQAFVTALYYLMEGEERLFLKGHQSYRLLYTVICAKSLRDLWKAENSREK